MDGKKHRVQSVERAFEILEAVATAGKEIGQRASLTLSQISHETGLSQATVHRLLKTLVALEYMKQLPSKEYTLGAKLIPLGIGATPPLADLAKPFLLGLEEAIHETANLAVLDGDLITYIAQVPSRHHMRMFTEVGRRVRPHASGVGKAILAGLKNDQVKRIVNRTGLPRYTDNTLLTVDDLLADLVEIRRRGYAIDDGEQEIGVKCIAVALPLSPAGATLPAAISVSGPSIRMDAETVAKSVEELRKTAIALVRASGSISQN